MCWHFVAVRYGNARYEWLQWTQQEKPFQYNPPTNLHSGLTQRDVTTSLKAGADDPLRLNDDRPRLYINYRSRRRKCNNGAGNLTWKPNTLALCANVEATRKAMPHERATNRVPKVEQHNAWRKTHCSELEWLLCLYTVFYLTHERVSLTYNFRLINSTFLINSIVILLNDVVYPTA